jgi:16S rRNA processing protein RimM
MSTSNSNQSSGDSDTPQPSYHHRNRRVVIPDGVMAVGLIVGAHGLRGEVRVEPHTDYAERFARGNTLLLGIELEEMLVVASRPHKDVQLVQFEGVMNRTDAEALRGLWLFIPEKDAAELGEDQYWIHDLIGMDVFDEQGRTLGVVSDILATGANDVFLVEAAEGVNRGQEILLPAIAEVVQRVDQERRQIIVQLLPGLLDYPVDSDDTV